MQYITLSNILTKLHVKDAFNVSRYVLSHKKIHKLNINTSQIGGTIEKFKFNDSIVKFYKYMDDDRCILNINENDDDETNNCLVIIIADAIAYIENISYTNKCIKNIVNSKGTTLLQIAIAYLKHNKTTYNINKIQLKDNALKYCKENNSNIRVSLLTTLTTGDTWYGKYGFIPYDADNDVIDNDGCKLYMKNKKLINSLKLKDTKVEYYILKLLKKYDTEIDDIDNVFSHYNNMPMNTFLNLFLKTFDKTCFIFNDFYLKLSKDLKIHDFYGSSFYMPL